MKKINLVLCAAAIACTAFFASCKNGAAETPKWKLGNEKTVAIHDYSVSGTITTQTANKTVNTAGTASTTDLTNTSTKVITSGYATLSWSDNANWDGNYSNQYGYDVVFNNVKGYTWTQSQVGTGTPVGTAPTTPSITSTTIGTLTFYKVGSKFYIQRSLASTDSTTTDTVNATSLVEVKSFTAEDLEAGKDINISFSYSDVKNNNNYQATTALNSDKTTTTVTYNLVLKAK